MEGLEERTQDILEIAAIVHDIACPLCREKYGNADGLDYQILLEADFLVNAGESKEYAKAIAQFRSEVFKTGAGLRLLDSMYLA